MEGGKLEKPVLTWFFENHDGGIIPVKEAEAWRIYSGKNQKLGEIVPRAKLIGLTDGTIYHEAVIDARKVFKEFGLEKAQERLRQGLADEVEKARGNVVPPRNFDVIGQNGEPVNMANLR